MDMDAIIAFVLLFIIIIQILITLGALLNDDFDNSFFKIFINVCSLTVFLLFLFLMNKPRAIDVYRGKTTLEITYKNRTPIDTTVVWKNK